MKRLTDAQVAGGYEKTSGAPSAASLRKDHLQAREDVKRLAALIRERIGGACCDRSLLTTSIPRCPWCATAEALLSEVES